MAGHQGPAMSNDNLISEYAFTGGELRGSQLALYAGRLVHDGGDVVEQVLLRHVAALRVEFLREGPKLKWAIIFIVVALVLNGLATPLQNLAASAANEVAEHARREGVSGGMPVALGVTFRALQAAASALPFIGLFLAAWGALLLFLYWRGRTALTLVFGAVEREYAVPGRDQALMAFAEAAGTRLAEMSA